MSAPNFADVQRAAQAIAPLLHRTPVLTCRTIDDATGASLFFKCENFQKAGAFKARGATNAVLSLSDQVAARGVATHSSGNHAAALSLAARRRGIPAFIVMPSSAPKVKHAAVVGYGGRVTWCEPTLEARESTLERVIAETGAHVVHPYDDARIIAGQGTAALELLEDVEQLDSVIAPVGGGGLLAGTAIAAHAMRPDVEVFAGEPAGADDAKRSLDAGKIIPSVGPDTIADGLLTSLGKLNFPIIQQHVRDVLVVDDAQIVDAMRMIWERMKIIVEPSCAVPLAAVCANPAAFAGKRVGVILSGGNVDLENLPFGSA